MTGKGVYVWLPDFFPNTLGHLAPTMVMLVPYYSYDRAPLANLGLWDYRGKIWDYWITPCLKLGLQKSALKLGLWISNSTKHGFSIHSKLGFWDFTLFEIGITGLRRFWNWDYGITGPPLWGPFIWSNQHYSFLSLWDYSKLKMYSSPIIIDH